MDEIPQFKGNRYISFSQYLTANIKYPTISRENSVCGRVYVTFVIDETGKVENATILRGLDSSINEEVLRVVNASPIWAPGKKDGQNVAVSYSIPVDFRLEGGECLFLKNNGGEHTGVHSILTDSAFEGSMLEDIDYYMFNTLSLGWINCDFYPFKGKRKVDMRVKLNITRTVSVHLIFTKYNSVLSGTYRNGCFVFDRVPKNEEVVVVGTMKSGNKFLFTSKKLVVSNDIQHLDSFEEITFEDMKEILDGLY
ncbi:MAG: energy transducer TonB, partial [Chlorobi bacterium]|nr:energy transducer TonB [Chlorobiota bacterium]